MKIKLQAQINGFNYSKKGKTIKMSMKVDALQLGAVTEILLLINSSFAIGIKKEDNNNIVIKNVLFDGLAITKDGEAKLKFEIEPCQIDINELNSLKDLIDIVIFKKDKSDSKTDTGDTND